MTRKEFEDLVQEAFDELPERFRQEIENVRIIVDDVETPRIRRNVGIRAGSMLLGLYEGVPLNRRGEGYGMYPVVPDTITLFQRNIESVVRGVLELRRCVREVLIHELGHYFGMSEEEIRSAGY